MSSWECEPWETTLVICSCVVHHRRLHTSSGLGNTDGRQNFWKSIGSCQKEVCVWLCDSGCVWLWLCVTPLAVCDSGCVWLQLCVTLAVWDWLAGSLNELSFASSSFCLTLPGSPRLFRIWTLGDQPGSELGAMWSKLRQWQNSGSVGLECLTQNSWHYEIILGVMINKGQWCLHTGAVRIYTLNMTVFLGGN